MALNFLLWEFLLVKRLEIEKTKTTFVISVLKVDITKVGFVCSISNFLINKTAQGRKSVDERKIAYLKQLGLNNIFSCILF